MNWWYKAAIVEQQRIVCKHIRLWPERWLKKAEAKSKQDEANEMARHTVPGLGRGEVGSPNATNGTGLTTTISRASQQLPASPLHLSIARPWFVLTRG